MTVYMGIDFGRKHLGIALADGPLARPVTTIEMNQETVGNLVKMVQDNQVGKIIVGLPEGTLDQEVKEFGTKIAQMSGIDVVYHPEALSTHDALEALRASGASQTKKGNDHVYAACIILEDYLESQTHS